MSKSKFFTLSEDEASMLKDMIYHYRDENRLGGDELSLLRRVSVFLGMDEAEAKEILA